MRPDGSKRVNEWISASPAVIAVAIVVYALTGHFSPGSDFASVLAVGAAAAAGAFISGVLLGFLFGLPRTLERPTAKGFLATNSNLDQISDWLTKILVGLGLVQLGKVSSGVGKLASSLAPGLGGAVSAGAEGAPGAKAFATALLIFSAVDGFLFGYLWSRIVLSKRFRLAAQDLEIVLADNTLQVQPRALPQDPTTLAETTEGPTPQT
jgi:hypothetical protein